MSLVVYAAIVHGNTVISNEKLFSYRCIDPKNLGWSISHDLWTDICQVLKIKKPDTRIWVEGPNYGKSVRPEDGGERRHNSLGSYLGDATYLRDINCLFPLSLIATRVNAILSSTDDCGVRDELMEFHNHHLIPVVFDFPSVTHFAISP